MTQKVTFHNKAAIKIQAQIYAGHALIAACLAGPGETHTISADSTSYDIFFRNGTTGREVARQLNSDATTFTLNHSQGRYNLT